jgi:hypothetical protein
MSRLKQFLSRPKVVIPTAIGALVVLVALIVVIIRSNKPARRRYAQALQMPLEIVDVAMSVMLHRTSPWHLPTLCKAIARELAVSPG